MILIWELRLKYSITDEFFISRGSEATPVQYLILLITPTVFKILPSNYVLFPFSLFRNFWKDEIPGQRGLISVSIFHHCIVQHCLVRSYIYYVQATLLKVFI